MLIFFVIFKGRPLLTEAEGCLEKHTSNTVILNHMNGA